MGNQIIKVGDAFHHHDSIHGLRGQVIFGRGRKITKYIDPFGKPNYFSSFEEELYSDDNIVPIGGYQFAFDKLFNIGLDQDSTLRVGDLNDEAPQMKIGVPRAQYKSLYYNAEAMINADTGAIILDDTGKPCINGGVNISAMNYVFGFMMGDGGAREDNVTAIAPDYKNRTLYRAIPFRMSNDGYPFQEGKYYGKQEAYPGSNASNPITSYYVKKFDTPAPHIVHAWATDNPEELSIVDDTVFASTSSLAIESYVEMNLSMSGYDGRGYFTSVDSTSRVNEISLVSGWYNALKDDYEALRMFTHFTRPSITLAEGDSIEVIYRLFAR